MPHFVQQLTLATFLTLGTGLPALAQDAGDPDGIRVPAAEYSPYLEHNYPDQVYFGDTHVHTSYSTDAGLFGTTIGPEEAYRFAKGEVVTSSTGVRTRLLRPLDWLVVADHAENMGLSPMIADSNPALLKSVWGRTIHDLVKDGELGDAYAMWGDGVATRNDPLADHGGLVRSMWERVTTAAEKHYEPGKFTAFIGYEWTSTPAGNNMHRNIIFRDNKDLTDRITPFSVYDSDDPEDLWAWLAAYEEKTGGQVLAIAHNGNLSNGLMFDDVTYTRKKRLTRDYAERRTRWEPLYEVTQMKGDGEAHPSLSPTDEFADFETWDRGSFGAPKEDGMIRREYAREALKRGLQYAAVRIRIPRLRPRPKTISSAKLPLSNLPPTQIGLTKWSRAICRIRREGSTRFTIIRPQHPDWPRCGRARILAKRFGTLWPARKSTQQPARAYACASLPAGTLRLMKWIDGTSPKKATRVAYRWAAICTKVLQDHRQR